MRTLFGKRAYVGNLQFYYVGYTSYSESILVYTIYVASYAVRIIKVGRCNNCSLFSTSPICYKQIISHPLDGSDALSSFLINTKVCLLVGEISGIFWDIECRHRLLFIKSIAASSEPFLLPSVLHISIM